MFYSFEGGLDNVEYYDIKLKTNGSDGLTNAMEGSNSEVQQSALVYVWLVFKVWVD